jgi:ABC-type multidrug transport system fused ATPase/permease subunit
MLGKQSKVMNMSQFGSALSYANGMTYILNLLVRSSAAIESEMSSVERLQEYADKLPHDAPFHLETDPAEGSWPSRGEIVFKGVTAAYPSRPEKPVLRDVNIRIQPGTTTFLVGRTGSGKSTMLSVLLRLLEIGTGSVIVDGEDITKLGAHTLRRGMELIPQDPFIFSGTIRTALDFECRYDDTSLWHALELVGMKEFVSGQEEKLDTIVSDNGSNFSVGQRQLLCLAGAVLRNPKILLLDEATASVDAGSDAFLQRTMRQNCPGATILSVMHRLSDQVLKECDKVLVMDNGVPAEFDTPKALMSNPDSLFSQIMEATRQG